MSAWLTLHNPPFASLETWQIIFSFLSFPLACIFLSGWRCQVWRFWMVTNLPISNWRWGRWWILGSSSRGSMDCAKDSFSTNGLWTLLAEENPEQLISWWFGICAWHLLFGKWPWVSFTYRKPQTPKEFLICWVCNPSHCRIPVWNVVQIV